MGSVSLATGAFLCAWVEPVAFQVHVDSLLSLPRLLRGFVDGQCLCWGDRRSRRVSIALRQYPKLEDASLMRAARVVCLNRADVFVGRQPCHEVSRLQHSVDIDEGIAIRFKAELKVERLGQALQDIREVRVTRDEMHRGCTIATADADLLGERQWTGEQHCRAKRGAHSTIQRQTPAAATQRQSISIAMDARVHKP